MPPRAWINALPSELKTRIAEECYQWESSSQKAHQLFPLHKEGHLAEYPSAIGALFRVSREWHEIAAPFRFRVSSFLSSIRLRS